MVAVSKTGKELRELAAKIEEVCRDARCYSIALKTVQHCTDHLTLLARVHDFNAARLDD